MSHCRCFVAILVSTLLMVPAIATLEEMAATRDKLTVKPRISARPHIVRPKARMARQFLNAHNNVRSVFGLQPLIWNNTLAGYARRWAKQRASDCELQHSPNSPYGENLFWCLRGKWGPKDVVKVWADEFKFYDSENNECINHKKCGHYTQIIWQKTKQLGCGRVRCKQNKGFLYVCSYCPPGNVYFQGPFGGHYTKSIVPPS